MTTDAEMMIVLAGAMVIALIVTVGIAFLLHRRFEMTLGAVFFAGFAVPVGWIVATFYFVTTDGPDGPPPGAIIMGNLSAAAILLPLTLLVGALTVRFSRR